MNVVFVVTETGEELTVMVSTDVAGLLAAVKGESVTFPQGTYKYDFHTLDHYFDDSSYRQELVIYLKTIQLKVAFGGYLCDGQLLVTFPLGVSFI